ncbi:hypothetical protein FB107DRAFT_280751, partial [Schizophyllum commune]
DEDEDEEDEDEEDEDEEDDDAEDEDEDDTTDSDDDGSDRDEGGDDGGGEEGDGGDEREDHDMGDRSSEDEDGGEGGMSFKDAFAWNCILYAIYQNRSLTVPELVEFDQIFLRDDYPERLIDRAIVDSGRSVIWTPGAYIPLQFSNMVGPSWRYFTRSHAFPPYISGLRLTRDMVINRAPTDDGDRRPQRIIAGPVLVDLVNARDARELALTTAGTTVNPELGMIYSVDDLYPRHASNGQVNFNDAWTGELRVQSPQSTPGSSQGSSQASETVVGTPPVPINRNWKVGQRTFRANDDSDEDMDRVEGDSGDEEEEGSDQGDGDDEGGNGEDANDDDNAIEISSDDDAMPEHRRLSPIDLTNEPDATPVMPEREPPIDLTREDSPPTAVLPRRMSTIELSSDDDAPAPASSRRMSTIELSSDEETPALASSRRMSTIELSSGEEEAREVTEDVSMQSERGYVSSDETMSTGDERNVMLPRQARFPSPDVDRHARMNARCLRALARPYRGLSSDKSSMDSE